MRLAKQYGTSKLIKWWLDQGGYNYTEVIDGPVITINLGAVVEDNGKEICEASVHLSGEDVVGNVEVQPEIRDEARRELAWFINLVNFHEVEAHLVQHLSHSRVYQMTFTTAKKLYADLEGEIDDILVTPMQVFRKYGGAIREVAAGRIDALAAFNDIKEDADEL